MSDETRIENGIEWFTLHGDETEWECQCARCGSDCTFVDCWNCRDGFVERDIGDDVCEEIIDVPCEYCNGKGGHWHCLSTPKHCNAHPMPGREHIESTALSAEAWRDTQ